MESFLYLFSIILTYSVFIYLGFRFSNKIKKPVTTSTFILILIATFFVGWVMVSTIINVFNFIVQLNWCLQGFGIGIILGLIKSKFKTKVVTN
jgi:hypothetical protein